MTNPMTFLTRPLLVTLLALGTPIVAAGQVHADDGSSSDPSRVAAASKLSDDGLSLYKARDYRHAIEKFLQAYALDPDPNLLFNTARCYEAMGDTDNAIEKYETFLSKGDADPQGKRRATEAIRNLRRGREAGAEASSGTTGSGTAGRTRATGLPSATAADNHDAELKTSATGADGKPGSSLLSPPPLILGAGVLAIAVGAVSYFLGASDHNKVTTSPGYGTAGQVDPMTEVAAKQLVDSGSSKKLIGAIGLGVGAALVATSAVLFVLTPHRGAEKEATGVAFGITPLSSGGQVSFQGRF